MQSLGYFAGKCRQFPVYRFDIRESKPTLLFFSIHNKKKIPATVQKQIPNSSPSLYNFFQWRTLSIKVQHTLTKSFLSLSKTPIPITWLVFPGVNNPPTRSKVAMGYIHLFSFFLCCNPGLLFATPPPFDPRKAHRHGSLYITPP